jgi:pimeloyl-ACP methyl ester carboxylesterase
MATMPIALQTGNMQEDKSPHTSGFVTVNGVKLHYLDWGGEGETLLFIAGSGDNAHTFDGMAPKFTDHFRVLALTRRGYGESDKPKTGYDLPTLAEDVRQFLDAMKITGVNLAGHSAGGNELIQFASAYPKRTLKLIFLDAAYDRREVFAIEAKDSLLVPPPAKDPLSVPSLTDKIQAEYFKYMDEFKPDFKKIKAPALSFYAIFETHWALKPGADEATRKRAQEFIEKEVQPYQWRNIERFRKEVVNGRVVVMRGTHHYFYKDLKRKDEVVREMRDFLLSK